MPLRVGGSFFLFFVLSLSLPLFGDEHRILSVGVYENEPKVFLSDSGKPAGLFIDIIEYIADREGWELLYIPGTWGEGLDRLSRGDIDLMPDVAYSSERSLNYSFHKEPVLSSWFQVFRRKGTGINSILDMDGKSVTVLERSVQEEAFTNLASALGLSVRMIPLEDYRSSFSLVSEGGADAAITNRFFGLTHAAKYGLEDTAIILHPSTLHYAAPLGQNQDVLDTLDEYLRDIKGNQDSVYYRSLKRWLSEDPPVRIPGWLIPLAVFLGGAVFLSLAGSLILKHQVSSRTRKLQRYNYNMQVMTDVLKGLATTLVVPDISRRLLEGVLKLTHFPGGFIELDASGKEFPREVLAENYDENGKYPFHLVYPIIGQKRPLGNLHLCSPAFIDQEQHIEELVQHLCSTAAMAILNSRLYRQVTHHQIELEKTVAERTSELQATTERALAADRIKSAFLATMSHELRTPLNSIIGFTGILIQELAGPLNPEQAKQLSMVKNSSHHLLNLINDVLDISKIEAGELSLSPSSFSAGASLQKILDMVRPQAEKKGINLVYQISPEVDQVFTDQRRFEQVFLNLLSNGLKFTDQGRVSLEAEKKEGRYVFTVSDTGMGIIEEDISGLFQPFHQIDSGLSRKHEGTGLGLSICKRLLDLMGGTITVQSEFGKGSTFTVIFPEEKINIYE